MELHRQEYRHIQQQMELSQNKLREHFENIKGAAETLKHFYGNVQQKEDQTELLRQKYYDMLANKSYNENDRDAYFQLEQDARDEKDMYVQESQKLAYKCSTYVVFSYQHSEQRENFMNTMLKDTDSFYLECESMRKERAKFLNQCSTLESELHGCHAKLAQCDSDLKSKIAENASLQQKCDDYEAKQQDLLREQTSLEQTKSHLTAIVDDMSEKNSHLTSDLTNTKGEVTDLNKELNNCHGNITIMNKDIDRRKILQNRAEEKISSQTANIESLKKQSHELSKRNKSLNQELTDTKTELVKVRGQRDKYQESTRQAVSDRNSMKEAYDRMRREKDQMEEQFGSMRHERELVGKEKDRLVSREYRIKKRNQELTDDHKSLSRLVEELREKYRRADERVRNDGSVKQKLKDTIKILEKEIEAEKRKNNKPVRHAGIQTDPRLACDSRDIAIQHARFKMKQALKARDQYAVDRNRMEEKHDRAMSALAKKSNTLAAFEAKVKETQDAYLGLQDKLSRTEKILETTKAELDREKLARIKMKKQEKAEAAVKVVTAHEPAPQTETREAASQTTKDNRVDAKEAEISLNLALCLQKKFDATKTELAQKLKDLDVTKLKMSRLENIIEQQKVQNDTLQRKIIYMEGKYERDRHYMRSVHNALATKNLPNIGEVGAGPTRKPECAGEGNFDGLSKMAGPGFGSRKKK